MITQKVTTAACSSRLPQVLIDYLWQLAGEDDTAGHTFVLSAKYVGAGEVQEILHRQGNYSSWRRVFGFRPVEATVEVRTTGHRTVMDLRGDDPALARNSREEGLPCSA